MKLTKNWRKLWKAISLQLMGLAIAIQSTWAQLPHDLKSSVPDDVVAWGTVVVLVLGVIGRFVDQKSVSE